MKKINIAIDGYSSCGKGTLAKQLAQKLNYVFIDSGAMYRAITYAIIESDISIEDSEKIESLLQNSHISFEYNPEQDYFSTLLNGVNIEKEIRTMEVSSRVSEVSKLESVRNFLVKQQQQIGLHKGVVMDGRDIGTVVFPDAELKIFMTARPEVRAQRRHHELLLRGDMQTSFDDVLSNLTERDSIDSSRAISPLKKADDAVVIDNSEMNKEQQLALAIDLVQKIIN
ncbi:MAG: (d)CMP kinase [Bacteroidota bacterium]|nr:(d)CMP kinase [Bacteroidota bacterium]